MPAVTETSLVIALSPAPTADAGIPHPEEQDDMTINEPRTPESMPSSAQSSTRRALVRGAAWVVPTALFATAAPAIAASDCVSSTVDANRPSTGRTDASSVSTVFTVPAGVFEIDVDIVGGAGGNSTAATQFSGLRTRGTLAVTPGQQLTLQVGAGRVPRERLPAERMGRGRRLRRRWLHQLHARAGLRPEHREFSRWFRWRRQRDPPGRHPACCCRRWLWAGRPPIQRAAGRPVVEL